MDRPIEILAPAGSYEGMKAAMNAGCDAVYIGGSSFGARAYANNLDEDTLLRAIDEAHIRNKKLYLTVNTLLKEKEHTEELYLYLRRYYQQGLDAVIVQDMGALHFIHEQFPKLAIHASTQTTLTMAQGANRLKPYGVTRLVTARELSLAEIKKMREETDLEIETFVHGALCYCYSGQCLMSSMIGGRSGNRGRCAQPCRMPYQFYSGEKKASSDKEKYLLSPKDINTVALIPDLIDAGINSLKIEGRMKRPEYAAAVSFVYRKYVDLYFELGKEGYNQYLSSKDFEKDMILLQDVYNRGGFSQGYGNTYNGKKMMSLLRPNHSGVYVGEVTSIRNNDIFITLQDKVNAQDILEIRTSEEEGYEFTVKDPHETGETISTYVGKPKDTENRKDRTASDKKSKEGRSYQAQAAYLEIGAKVYRTKNNLLLDELAVEYVNKDKRLPIKGVLSAKLSKPLELKLSYKDCEVTAYQDIVQEAMKQPMTKEKLSAPIEKTGDTLYYFDELIIDYDENVFVPVAWLNEIRREAITLLQEAVVNQYRRTLPSAGQAHPNKEASLVLIGGQEAEQVEPGTMNLCVSVQTEDQLQTALLFSEISAIYADYDTLDRNKMLEYAVKAADHNKRFYVSLPHICRLSEYQKLTKSLETLVEETSVSGFIVKNFEEISLLESLVKDISLKNQSYVMKEQKNILFFGNKEIILNYNMYIYNQEAKAFWREQGIGHYTAPVELNYQELLELGISDCDMIVYGYQPVMVSAQCLFESTKGCNKCKEGNKGHLVDRLGKKFYVQTNCNGCYNILYNGQPLSLLKQEAELHELAPKSLRLDFTGEDIEFMKEVLQCYINVFVYHKPSSMPKADYTNGHFKRGVE